MRQTILLFTFIVCLVCNSVFADVTLFTNRDNFNAQGIITYNYGFEDYPSSGFSYPGDPYTSNGVTYTTGSNVIVSPGTNYYPLSNVLAYNGWTPLSASIETSSQFSMFGFGLGYIGNNSEVILHVSTNLNSYSFTNLNAPDASQGMNFHGFTTGSGEYFTGLILSSLSGPGSAPVIDDVTLGHTQISTVPVPSSILLAGIGIISVGRLLKKRP